MMQAWDWRAGRRTSSALAAGLVASAKPPKSSSSSVAAGLKSLNSPKPSSSFDAGGAGASAKPPKSLSSSTGALPAGTEAVLACDESANPPKSSSSSPKTSSPADAAGGKPSPKSLKSSVASLGFVSPKCVEALASEPAILSGAATRPSEATTAPVERPLPKSSVSAAPGGLATAVLMLTGERPELGALALRSDATTTSSAKASGAEAIPMDDDAYASPGAGRVAAAAGVTSSSLGASRGGSNAAAATVGGSIGASSLPLGLASKSPIDAESVAGTANCDKRKQQSALRLAGWQAACSYAVTRRAKGIQVERSS